MYSVCRSALRRENCRRHSRTSRLGLGNRTELLHHSQRVEAVPALDDLSARDPVDRDSVHLDPLAGGGHAHQLTVVGALAGPAGDDEIALGDLLVHFDAGIRVGGVVHLSTTLGALGASYVAERVLRIVRPGI